MSLSDPDARPIRKGKLRQPTEFGTVMQIAEMCENTRRGARGLILPAATEIGIAERANMLPGTGAELSRLGARPKDIALDGGFAPGPVAEHLPDADRTFIAGKPDAGSKKTNRRLAKFRVGARAGSATSNDATDYARSRLKGHAGARTWAGWAILAYNLDTLAIRTN